MPNLTTDRKKSHTIVSFGKNEKGKLMIELVLTSWISESHGKTVCKYPDVTSTELDGLLENKTKAESSWKSYDCDKLWGADDYEQGKRRLERCYMKDEYASTDCGKSLPKGNSIAKLSSKEARDLLSSSAMQLNNHSEEMEENDDAYRQFLERNLVDLKERSDRQMESIEHLKSSIKELSTLFQTSLDKLKRSMAYITKQNEELKLSITELKSSGGLTKTLASMLQPFEDFDFPITTLEKFLEFDVMLKQNREKKSELIQLLEFFCTGLADSQKCIIEVLPKIMHKNIQLLYSGQGRGMKNQALKKNFSITQLYLCFEAVVKDKYQSRPDGCSNLIGRVGIWLGGAGDREGGRKNRGQ